MSKAKNGDTIKIHYTGTLNDGTVFDSSEGREPLQFQIGSGQVIPGFDNGVDGMALNEKKTIDIDASNAYGDYRDDLVITVPKTEFPPDVEPQEGLQLQMQSQEGQQFMVIVKDVGDTGVKLDANHPLAGQDLHFDVELVEINPA